MKDTSELWDAKARLVLAARSVPKSMADTALGEVSGHCADSGERPEEAFGTPAEFATAVATERVPAEARAGYDRDGLVPGDYRFAGLATAGIVAVLAGVCLWVSTGTTLALTPAGLVGTALAAAALASAFGATSSLSVAGVPRVIGWRLASATAVVLAAVAFTTLPKTELGGVPTPALCVIGIVLLYVAARGKPAHEALIDLLIDSNLATLMVAGSVTT